MREQRTSEQQDEPLEIVGLPPRARRVLINWCKRGYDELLPVTWYEYPAASNFDKWDREELRTAAEDAGFVVYTRGGPRVTEEGFTWAQTAE
jgi:hypothetical protein